MITSPTAGASIGSSNVTISGTAAGDAVSVSIYEGATLRATTGVAGGRWSASVGFGDGTHTVSARARDLSNIESAPSTSLTFRVDTAQPAVPVITAPEAGSTLTNSNITVEGIAEPNARVEVAVSTGGTLVATADAGGSWRASKVFTSTTHTLRATAIDAAGNRSSQGAAHTFTVDLIDPTPPTFFGPAQNEVVNVSRIRFFGTAEAGAAVTLFEGSPLASVPVLSDGTWSVELPFNEGTHAVQGRTTDPAGRASALSAPRSFRVDLTAPAQPTITAPVENGLVASTVTVTGTAEPGARVDLLRGTANVSFAHTTAASDGRWSMSLVMQHGQRVVSAKATDQAGNVGPPAPLRTFNVDGDNPTVSFTTSDGTIFWPTDSTRLRGTAADGFGVHAIELQFYDLLGRALPYQIATCASCPLGTQVDWFSTFAPPRGRYVVKAYAIDRVGHRSEASVITVVRL